MHGLGRGINNNIGPRVILSVNATPAAWHHLGVEDDVLYNYNDHQGFMVCIIVRSDMVYVFIVLYLLV